MRACFLGQNVCALGYGVAMVQTPPLNQASDPLSEALGGATEERGPAPSPNPLPNLMLRELHRRQVPHS